MSDAIVCTGDLQRYESFEQLIEEYASAVAYLTSCNLLFCFAHTVCCEPSCLET